MSATQAPIFRQASRAELALAVEWAAREGWNPGLDDLEIFWETDPEGFVCMELAGEVIGTGSVVSYGGFGFMGFFIVRPDLRGRGLGAPFWHWRKARLAARLNAGAAIGMDGVFAMQPFYAKGGFVFSHRTLRMAGVGSAGPVAPGVVDLSEIPLGRIEALDRRCFGFERTAFLKRWIRPRHGLALGLVESDRLSGYGVIRACRSGFKIGPIFAETAGGAEALFQALGNRAAGEPLFLDVPENNPQALALAERHGLKESFGCARMYHGPAPDLPWAMIYGITTFELG